MTIWQQPNLITKWQINIFHLDCEKKTKILSLSKLLYRHLLRKRIYIHENSLLVINILELLNHHHRYLCALIGYFHGYDNY